MGRRGAPLSILFGQRLEPALRCLVRPATLGRPRRPAGGRLVVGRRPVAVVGTGGWAVGGRGRVGWIARRNVRVAPWFEAICHRGDMVARTAPRRVSRAGCGGDIGG